MYNIIDGGFVIGYISPRLYKISGSATDPKCWDMKDN